MEMVEYKEKEYQETVTRKESVQELSEEFTKELAVALLSNKGHVIEHTIESFPEEIDCGMFTKKIQGPTEEEVTFLISGYEVTVKRQC